MDYLQLRVNMQCEHLHQGAEKHLAQHIFTQSQLYTQLCDQKHLGNTNKYNQILNNILTTRFSELLPNLSQK